MPPHQEPIIDEPPSVQDQLTTLIQLATNSNNRFDAVMANITTQSARLVTQQETMNNVVHLLTTLTQHLHQNHHREPLPPPPPPRPPPPPPPNNNPRPPKIQLPNFDGSHPLDWLFQAENYFTYYTIPEDQR
ncbi:hypothetical protein LXL04_007252 [Taraxacum kok-saghyz]